MAQRRALRLLAALAALNVLSYVDRQLLAALAPLLIADLGLSRAQVGALIGPAFIAVFALSTLGMALLADRAGRTRLISAGLAIWSAATALTGAASGFATLAACRALVGVGEATLSPAALAMIGDAFPRARLGLASGIFYAGIPVGFACSFALAGWIAPSLGWRACFAILGLVGIAAVALTRRLADPRDERGEEGTAGARAGRQAEQDIAVGGPGGAAATLARLRRALADEPALLVLMLAGAALAYTSASSQLGITWLVQERGFEYRHAAFVSAVVIATAGLAGCVGFGWLTDRAGRGGTARRLRAFVAIGAVSLSLAAAFYSAAPGSPLFWAGWLGAQGFLLGWYGPLLAALLELAPAPARAPVVGLGLMVVNAGVAVGPWVTGWTGDRSSLTRGLLVSVGVGAVGLALALAASLRAGRRAAAAS